MHPEPIPTIPEETVRVAQSALPKGNVWLQSSLHGKDLLITCRKT